MKRVGIVYLITESPEAAGVLDIRTESRRKTYCEEKSLSMSEAYQARATGFNPQFRLILPQDFEYRGETLCEYKGERYRIIRDYRDEKTGNATELTLERERGNAGSEGSGAPVGQSPEGDSDQNESAETSGANANSGATATIEDAERPAVETGDPSTPPGGSAQDDSEGEPAVETGDPSAAPEGAVQDDSAGVTET